MKIQSVIEVTNRRHQDCLCSGQGGKRETGWQEEEGAKEQCDMKFVSVKQVKV